MRLSQCLQFWLRSHLERCSSLKRSMIYERRNLIIEKVAGLLFPSTLAFGLSLFRNGDVTYICCKDNVPD